MQKTLTVPVIFSGVGLHSGTQASLTLRPAPEGHGLVFRRTDLPAAIAEIPALWDQVSPSRLCTLLDNGLGATVSTVEHIMAAVAGTGLSNLLLEIDGPEIPILDGSARPFVAGILEAGVKVQSAPVFALRILQPVEVTEGEALARLEPTAGDALEMAFDITFADEAIGHQSKRLTLSNGTFLRELADSRTFCRRADVEAMRSNGLALGGTYHNAVVVEGAEVLSPGGLRHKDEAVRHKMLDALGDLALAGGPILGRYTGIRAGHALTNKLLRALFARPEAFAFIEVTPERAHQLPGASLSRRDLAAIAAR